MEMSEINAKYQQICQQIGDVQYKLRQHESLLKQLFLEADKLNELAAMFQRPQIEETKKEA